MIKKFGVSVNKPHLNKIVSTKEGSLRYDWGIQIFNLDIRAFASNINFTLETKEEKLKELLNSYQSCKEHFKKDKKFEEILKACKVLKSKNQKVTNKNIAHLINRKHSYVCYLTAQMVQKGMLKVIKQQAWNGKGSICKEFETRY